MYNYNEKQSLEQVSEKNLTTKKKIFNEKTTIGEKITFIADKILSMLSENLRKQINKRQVTGRPGLYLYNVLCVQIFMSLYSLESMKTSIKFLREMPNVKKAIKIDNRVNISYTSVSRLGKKLSSLIDLSKVSKKIIDEAIQNGLIKDTNILSADSSMLPAHEKPKDFLTFNEYSKKKEEEKKEAEKKSTKHQGRYKKGSPEEKACHERQIQEALQQQMQEMIEFCGPLSAIIENLNRTSAFATKLNSSGHMQTFLGYKGHFLSTRNGIILAHIFTGANESDMKVFIPLMRLCPVKFSQVLADKGYDSEKNRRFVSEVLHSGSIIDKKAPKNADAAQKEACKLKGFEAELYKSRTSVERCNKYCF